MATVLDALAQHSDGAALVDLALKAGEELAAGGAILTEAEGMGGVGLRDVEEGSQLDEVDAVLSIVVVMIAGGPPNAAVAGRKLADRWSWWNVAGVAGQGSANEAFEAAFGEIGGHERLRIRWSRREQFP